MYIKIKRVIYIIMKTAFVYGMSLIDNGKIIYVGSTWDMKKRTLYHKSNCGTEHRTEYNYNLYKYIRTIDGMFDKIKINILEEFECETRRDREKKEQEYIDKYGLDNLYNDRDAYLTPEEKAKRKKASCMKSYYKYHEQSKAKNREQHAKNKDYYDKKNAEYHAKNREAILAKQKIKHKCECGGSYSNNSKARHLKTKKHQKFLNYESK